MAKYSSIEEVRAAKDARAAQRKAEADAKAAASATPTTPVSTPALDAAVGNTSTTPNKNSHITDTALTSALMASSSTPANLNDLGRRGLLNNYLSNVDLNAAGQNLENAGTKLTESSEKVNLAGLEANTEAARARYEDQSAHNQGLEVMLGLRENRVNKAAEAYKANPSETTYAAYKSAVDDYNEYIDDYNLSLSGTLNAANEYNAWARGYDNAFNSLRDERDAVSAAEKEYSLAYKAQNGISPFSDTAEGEYTQNKEYLETIIRNLQRKIAEQQQGADLAATEEARAIYTDKIRDLQRQVAEYENRLGKLEEGYANVTYAGVYADMSEELKSMLAEVPELMERRWATTGDGFVPDEQVAADSNARINEIRNALRQAGYDDKQIESLIAREQRSYNAQKTAQLKQAEALAAVNRSGAANVINRTFSSLASGAGILDAAIQGLTNGKDAFTGQRRLVDYNTFWQNPYSTNVGTTAGHNARIYQNMLAKYDGDVEKAEKATNDRIWLNDMGVSMLQTGITLALAPIPGLGATAGLLLQSGSAATATMHQYHEMGYSDGQAIMMGLAAGAAEYVTEKIGVDNFFDLGGIKNLRGNVLLKQLFKDLGSQALAEGSEEVLSSIMNGLADAIVTMGDDAISRKRAELMAQGMSQDEADKTIMRDLAMDLGKDFLGGAISGGLFGMAHAPISLANYADMLTEVINQARQGIITPDKVIAALETGTFEEEFKQFSGIELTGTTEEKVNQVLGYLQGLDQAATAAQPEQENQDSPLIVQPQETTTTEQPVQPTTSQQPGAVPVQQQTAQPQQQEEAPSSPLADALVGEQTETQAPAAPAGQQSAPASPLIVDQSQTTPSAAQPVGSGTVVPPAMPTEDTAPPMEPGNGYMPPNQGGGEGPQVKSEEKTISQNYAMDEEQRKAAGAGTFTHERVSRELLEKKADEWFERDESGRITNSAEVAKYLLSRDFGMWGNATVQEVAMKAMLTEEVQNDPALYAAMAKRYVDERSQQAQALALEQKWISHTPVGKIAEAQRLIKSIQKTEKPKDLERAEKEAESLKQAIEAAVPESADAAVEKIAQGDMLFDVVQHAEAEGEEAPERKKSGDRTWEEEAADAIVKKVDVSDPKKKDKTLAKQMLSDLLRITKDAAPKHTAGTRKNPADNTEAFQRFLQHRAEYEQIIQKAQEEIAKKYADNFEMLQAFQDWLDNGISLRRTLAGVVREHGIEIKDVLRKSYKDKERAVALIRDNILNNTDLTEQQKAEAAEMIHSYFWGEVTARSRAEVEKFVAKSKKQKTKSDTKKRSVKQQLEDMANMGAFGMEDLSDDVSDELVEKLIKEKSQELNSIIRSAGYIKWRAVANIVTDTLADLDLDVKQKVALADKIHERLWSEVEARSVKAARATVGWQEKATTTQKKTLGQQLEELVNLGEFVSDPDLLDALRQKAVDKVLQANNQAINDILSETQERKDQAIQEILDSIFADTTLHPNQLEDMQSMIEVAIRDEIDARNRKATERFVKPQEKTQPRTAQEVFMERYNQGFFQESDIKAAVLEKAGLPSLTDAEIQMIYHYMSEAQKFKDTDPEMAKRLEGVADRIIAEKMPIDKRAKVLTFAMDSMLLGFKTLISKGFGGNATMAIIEQTLTKNTTALIDSIVSLATKERRYLRPDKGYYKAYGEGLVKGLKDTVEDAVTGIHTPKSGVEAEIRDQVRTFNNEFMNAVDALVKVGLEIIDRPFYEGAYNARMQELRRLRDKAKLPAEALKDFEVFAQTEARLYALDAVFQKRGKGAELAEAMNKAKGIAQSLGEGLLGIDIAGHLTAPFVYTPGNIMQVGMEYLPVVGAIKNINTTIGELVSSKKSFDQARFSREAGRNVSGMFLTALAALMVKHGLVSGDDEDELTEEMGVQANSFKIGDTWYSHEWIPILSPIFAGTESFMSALEEGGENPYLNAAMDAGTSILRASAFSGVSRMFGSGQGLVRGFSNTLMSGTGQFLPQTVRRGARMADEYERSTYDKNMLTKQLNYFKAGIPSIFGSESPLHGMTRESLNVKYDLFGNPVEANQGRKGWDKFFEIYINPSYTSKEGTDDPRIAELWRLRQVGHNVPIPDVPTAFDFNGDGKDERITAAEHDRYWQTRNSTFGTLYSEAFDSAAYGDLTDEQKQRLIKSLWDYASKMSTFELYEGRGLEYDNVTKAMEAASDAANPAKYFVVNKVFDLTTDAEKGRNYESLDGILSLYGSLPANERRALGDGARIDDLFAAKEQHIDSKTWYRAYDEYRRIDEFEDGSATDKATMFADWLSKESGLSSRQIALLEDQMVYTPYIPAQATRYHDMQDIGVSGGSLMPIYNAVGDVEALPGETSVKAWQTYEAVANANAPVEDIDKAMIVYMGGYPEEGETNNLITKYELMRGKNFTPADFAFAYQCFTNAESDKDARGNTIRGSKERNFIAALGERSEAWASWGSTLYDLFYAGADDLAKWKW